jgi:hypothetical protein
MPKKKRRPAVKKRSTKAVERQTQKAESKPTTSVPKAKKPGAPRRSTAGIHREIRKQVALRRELDTHAALRRELEATAAIRREIEAKAAFSMELEAKRELARAAEVRREIEAKAAFSKELEAKRELARAAEVRQQIEAKAAFSKELEAKRELARAAEVRREIEANASFSKELEATRELARAVEAQRVATEQPFKELAALVRARNDWANSFEATIRDLFTTTFRESAQLVAQNALSHRQDLTMGLVADWSKSISLEIKQANQFALQSLNQAAVDAFSEVHTNWTHEFLSEFSQSIIKSQLTINRFNFDELLEGITSTALVQSIEESSNVASTEENAFANVVTNAWQAILSHFPHLSVDTKINILFNLITILVTIVVAINSSSSFDSQTDRVIVGVAAVEAIVESLPERVAAEIHNRERRYVVAQRALPVRETADREARRIGLVNVGQELEILDQVGRWVYVRGLSDAASLTGWVFYRYLSPRKP